MPMTCTAQATETSQRHETDIIEKITGTANAAYMLACIDASLDFLQLEYFGAAPCEVWTRCGRTRRARRTRSRWRSSSCC